MKILVTAFEPFGGDTINSTMEALQRIPEHIGEITVVKAVIPTVFGKSVRVTAEIIEREHPDAVLCLGQAGGRSDLSIERVAINVDDARIPDNEGNQPIDQPVFGDGPAAYFSTLPIKAIAQAIRECGIPASISNTAGTFVCNHLMYAVLYILDKKYPDARAGFLHVPLLPEQVAKRTSSAPSMNLADIVKGIEAAILAIAQNRSDIVLSDGKIN